jgi:ribosomal 50S subunit-recycling heat shock protein
MAPVQVVMEMSAEAVFGIATGTMVRHGGAVYHAKGGIFEHLKDAVVPTAAKEMPVPAAQASESIVSTVAKHLKNPKVIIVIGLGAVLLGGMIYVKDKNKKKAKQEVALEKPKCVADYNDSVVAYLDAINSGNVSLDKINSVIKNVDTLKENKEITIEFAQDKSETLVNYVYDYTKKLAEANSYELIDFEKATSISADNTLTYLRHYLEIQKQIFEEAA